MPPGRKSSPKISTGPGSVLLYQKDGLWHEVVVAYESYKDSKTGEEYITVVPTFLKHNVEWDVFLVSEKKIYKQWGKTAATEAQRAYRKFCQNGGKPFKGEKFENDGYTVTKTVKKIIQCRRKFWQNFEAEEEQPEQETVNNVKSTGRSTRTSNASTITGKQERLTPTRKVGKGRQRRAASSTSKRTSSRSANARDEFDLQEEEELSLSSSPTSPNDYAPPSQGELVTEEKNFLSFSCPASAVFVPGDSQYPEYDGICAPLERRIQEHIRAIYEEEEPATDQAVFNDTLATELENILQQATNLDKIEVADFCSKIEDALTNFRLKMKALQRVETGMAGMLFVVQEVLAVHEPLTLTYSDGRGVDFDVIEDDAELWDHALEVGNGDDDGHQEDVEKQGPPEPEAITLEQGRKRALSPTSIAPSTVNVGTAERSKSNGASPAKRIRVVPLLKKKKPTQQISSKSSEFRAQLELDSNYKSGSKIVAEIVNAETPNGKPLLNVSQTTEKPAVPEEAPADIFSGVEDSVKEVAAQGVCLDHDVVSNAPKAADECTTKSTPYFTPPENSEVDSERWTVPREEHGRLVQAILQAYSDNDVEKLHSFEDPKFTNLRDATGVALYGAVPEASPTSKYRPKVNSALEPVVDFANASNDAVEPTEAVAVEFLNDVDHGRCSNAGLESNDANTTQPSPLLTAVPIDEAALDAEALQLIDADEPLVLNGGSMPAALENNGDPMVCTEDQDMEMEDPAFQVIREATENFNRRLGPNEEPLPIDLNFDDYTASEFDVEMIDLTFEAGDVPSSPRPPSVLDKNNEMTWKFPTLVTVTSTVAQYCQLEEEKCSTDLFSEGNSPTSSMDIEDDVVKVLEATIEQVVALCERDDSSNVDLVNADSPPDDVHQMPDENVDPSTATPPHADTDTVSSLSDAEADFLYLY